MPLPTGYAPPGSMPRVQPQPPITAPPPYPPQGTSPMPAVARPPVKKAGIGGQAAALISQPIIRVYNSIFGG